MIIFTKKIILHPPPLPPLPAPSIPASHPLYPRPPPPLPPPPRPLYPRIPPVHSPNVPYGLNPKFEKGHNSLKFSQNCMKSWSCHLKYVPKQYVWYHDPSSSGSPDIVLTRLLCTRRRSRKMDIIQSNTYRILPKVNQVFCTLDILFVPNIMIQAQARF